LPQQKFLLSANTEKLSQAQSKQQFSPGIHTDFPLHFLLAFFAFCLFSLIDICSHFARSVSSFWFLWLASVSAKSGEECKT